MKFEMVWILLKIFYIVSYFNVFKRFEIVGLGNGVIFFLEEGKFELSFEDKSLISRNGRRRVDVVLVILWWWRKVKIIGEMSVMILFSCWVSYILFMLFKLSFLLFLVKCIFIFREFSIVSGMLLVKDFKIWNWLSSEVRIVDSEDL